jgi:hypothetical protein
VFSESIIDDLPEQEVKRLLSIFGRAPCDKKHILKNVQKRPI